MANKNRGSSAETIRPKRRRSRARSQESRAGWLMATPAILLLLAFLIIPFFMAFGFAFTNQRLISPNPTEFVGLRNFKRLLTVRYVPIEAETDEAGNLLYVNNEGDDIEVDENGRFIVFDVDGDQIPVDANGDLIETRPDGTPIMVDMGRRQPPIPAIEYEATYKFPRTRTFTRDNPDFPKLDGLQEAFTFVRGTTQHTILGGDAVFLKSLLNIFYFAAVIVPIQGGLGLGLALLVNQKLRGINFFRAIYFIPVVISMVIVSILWRFIYDANNGLLNNLLGFFTAGLFKPVDWLGSVKTAMPAVMMMSIWQAVGFHMIIWLAGLQTIPSMLYEAADIDGANNWQKFRYVTWPGLHNTFVFVLITITMAAFGLFTQIDIMTRGGPLDSTTTVIHQMVQRGFQKQDIAYGSTISVFFFLMVLSVAVIQRFLTRDDAR